MARVAVDRGRTAIVRTGLSRPIRLAMEAGLLPPDGRVFDYGCGRGRDMKRLRESGVDASGWDPVHAPRAAKRSASLVNLGYVVNVIEHAEERAATLTEAWDLAEDVLVVGARMNHELGRLVDGGADHADGKLTRHGTFQKVYSQDELGGWIDRTLPEDTPPAVPAGSGVFFVFRDPARREGYLATRYAHRRAAPRISRSEALYEANRAALDRLADFVVDRGRLPAGTETIEFADVAGAFVSLKRAFTVLKRVTDEDAWAAASAARREELLLWLALGRFANIHSTRRSTNRPPIGSLPERLQLDVREFFGNYKSACEEGDALLFSVGDREALEEAVVASPVGKRLPGAMYVHVDALDRLPLALRVFEGCARACVGGIDEANIVKINRREAKVSYLCYPNFDRDPHPALAWSMRVALSQNDVKVRDFSASANPPVLHRKETFIAEDDARHAKFARLTVQEVRAGLLDRTDTIGTQQGWEAVLKQAGRALRGHRLVRRAESASD